jgi:hypothetical protein
MGKLGYIWRKIVNAFATFIERNSIEFKYIEWNTYLIELNTIFFSFGFIRVNISLKFQLNSNQFKFNLISIQTKVNWIDFFHNLAQFNQIMKFQVLKAHVYLTFHIHASGLVRGVRSLRLEFHIDTFHNCRVDGHTIGP